MVLELRLLTVQDYHRMTETGILDAEERVELIAGQIVRMAAKGTAHSAAVTRVELLLRSCLGHQVLLRLQDPIQLDNYSEPEPDIAVVKLNSHYYEDHHPRPSDVYLVIEVADTTLQRDLKTKALLYAQSGIPDYWVLDINDRQLHVFRSPSSSGYQQELILAEAMNVAPLAFPNCAIAVREMLSSVQ
ncbi:MAG: Uma2 family endonuclease [Trichocoleus desertorum ATA4-8-CV12]|jgi:Uma2 family endonuclease|nr:Uma2 family endonuclease [Trichocoleus desertorum ATA4-8-CV12]